MLSRLRTPLAMTALGLSVAACNSDPTGYYSQGPVLPVDVQSVNIDAGEALEVDPGKGVGVFVEVKHLTDKDNDEWHVFTTCDTTTSQYTCGFDIVASVAEDEKLTVTDQADLEAPDEVLPVDSGATRLVLETGEDVDGVSLETPSGAKLRLDVFWDSSISADPTSGIHWISDTTVHTGVPSNPVDFVPSAP